MCLGSTFVGKYGYSGLLPYQWSLLAFSHFLKYFKNKGVQTNNDDPTVCGLVFKTHVSLEMLIFIDLVLLITVNVKSQLI